MKTIEGTPREALGALITQYQQQYGLTRTEAVMMIRKDAAAMLNYSGFTERVDDPSD